jgi:hypothetical protein
MSLEEYSLAYVEVDGVLLLEEADVKIHRTSGAQKQLTVAKGLAGFSPGAGEMSIEVTNAVPAGGFEVNPGKYFTKGLKIAKVKIVAAGLVLTTSGQIMDDNFSHGVNKEASIQFTGTFELKDWESA